MQQQDPDAGVIAIFRPWSIKNEGKSALAGRPIHDDLEICELRFAGSKNVFAFPATAESGRYVEDPINGRRVLSYAERFSRQYQQFKSHQQQTKSGTPLDYLQFLTEGKKAELRALNIYTCEALAAIDGAELKNLGHGGREMKNAAEKFLAEGSDQARLTRLENELEAANARNAVLLADLEARAARKVPADEFDGMSDDDIREHVRSLTDVDLRGDVPRKTLIRMVRDHREASPT
jgi:hypothetical protein